MSTRLRPHTAAVLPGLLAVALMILWAAHDGGYDADTWYWGALVLLATATAVVLGLGVGRLRLSRLTAVALLAFGLYVAWSYLSITWARSPGDALQGSNRALLYLLVFALFVALPWTPEGALAALLAFVLGVGAIAIVALLRLASSDHVGQMVVGGRLRYPTGYFNSTTALFTIATLVAIALAARRELPALLRGALIAIASAGLQLAVIGQSRGWLFTLPLVVVTAFVVVGDRLRVAAASILSLVAVLVPLDRLLHLYHYQPGRALDAAAGRAGHTSLAMCAVAFVAGTLIAWGDTLTASRSLSPARRRALGGALATLAVTVACAGGVVATKGHPIGFITRQWHGFVHSSRQTASGSYFGVVGSGRYDFWRVSADAVLAQPIGGLGQDNFADYYITRRRTNQEPQWTHSLEIRLLAHTGVVGLVLFGAFAVATITAALRTRRRGGELARWVAGAALLPLTVWVIHGSLDWFWEMPALTGPALGFLGMAAALGEPLAAGRVAAPRLAAIPRGVATALGAGVLIAAVAVLGFPYLAVREVSTASDVRASSPTAALSDLSNAAGFDPLSALPARLAGTIALQTGQFTEAERRFTDAISRERGGWFAWLGEGLAASALGDSARAYSDFKIAATINSLQPAIKQALGRVNSTHPLTPPQAFRLLVLTQ